MTAPERWDLECTVLGGAMTKAAYGEYVLWEDYATLLAEKERLEAERESYRKQANELAVRVMAAEARAARLEEAGNRLSFAAQTSGGTAGRDEGLCAAIDAWAAALADAPREGETREGEG